METCSTDDDHHSNEDGDLALATNLAPKINIGIVDMPPAKLNLAANPCLAPKKTTNVICRRQIVKKRKNCWRQTAVGKLQRKNYCCQITNGAKKLMSFCRWPTSEMNNLQSANYNTVNWAAEISMEPINNTDVQPTTSTMAINNVTETAKNLVHCLL